MGHSPNGACPYDQTPLQFLRIDMITAQDGSWSVTCEVWQCARGEHTFFIAPVAHFTPDLTVPRPNAARYHTNAPHDPSVRPVSDRGNCPICESDLYFAGMVTGEIDDGAYPEVVHATMRKYECYHGHTTLVRADSPPLRRGNICYETPL